MSEHCTWCGLKLPENALTHCSPMDCIRALQARVKAMEEVVETARMVAQRNRYRRWVHEPDGVDLRAALAAFDEAQKVDGNG